MGKNKQRNTTPEKPTNEPPRSFTSPSVHALERCTETIARLTRPVLVGVVLDPDTRKPIAGGRRIDQVTGKATHVVAIDLVLEHLEAWAGLPDPLLHQDDGLPIDGEATDPAQLRSRLPDPDAEAISRAIRQATRDLHDLRRALTAIRKLTQLVDRITIRAVETIHPDKLPKASDQTSAIPGCKSCARTRGTGARRIGGHFAPVRDDVAGHGLCDWCYRHALAVARERGLEQITTDCWPPLEACDLYHRQSARAAGLYLAKRTTQRPQRGAA